MKKISKPRMLHQYAWNGRHYARVQFPDGSVEELKMTKGLADNAANWHSRITKYETAAAAIVEPAACPECGRPC